MLAGLAATEKCVQFGTAATDPQSLLPADLDGAARPPANSPNYLVGLGTNALTLLEFTPNFGGTPVVSGPTSLSVTAFNQACSTAADVGVCIPQLGVTQLLDSLGDRVLHRLAYRNFGDHEAMLVNHAITTTNGVGVRLYELCKGTCGDVTPSTTWIVKNEWTHASVDNYRWMGSAAMDRLGNIALGYSLSSPAGTIYPSIAYAVRKPGDDPGLGPERIVVYGGGAQSGADSEVAKRWGDYTAMTIDPADDCTFWYTNQYLKNTGLLNWSTRIASFRMDNCGQFSLSAISTSTQPVKPGGSATYTVTLDTNSSDAVQLSISGLPQNASAAFNPSSLSCTPSPSSCSAQSTLTISTRPGVKAGTYNLKIAGSSFGSVHSTNATLTISK
jgi:hypothetical protein